jgi:hypothetical protein
MATEWEREREKANASDGTREPRKEEGRWWYDARAL